MNSFAREFKQCPVCHSKDTCARLGAALFHLHEMPEGQVISLSQEVLFLKPPQLAGVSVPSLVAHYDVCASCGTRYCVRVEKRDIPVQFKPVPGVSPFMFKGNS